MSGRANRVAVVTGAARGLGRAYSLRLAADGFDVVAVDRNDCAGTAQEVREIGPRSTALRCDVGSASDVLELAAAVESEYGRCDVLINNAAIFSRAGLDELEYEDWAAVLRVNLDGMLFTCKSFVPGMRERGWGRVINVSSTTTELVMQGWLAYITSKSGIVGFSRALASDLGPSGITVNVVMPGLTRTDVTIEEAAAGLLSFEDMIPMQPIKRTVETSDLADVVAFLASEDSRMMTGQTLVVDGGVVRK